MRNFIVFTMLLSFAVIMTGCRSTCQTTPVSPLAIQAKLNRADYSVLKKVEGKSNTKSYLCGLVQYVDGHTIILWIFKDFEEKYAGVPGTLSSPLAGTVALPSTSTRAYYKALKKAPEADMVIPKSCVYKKSGFPVFYSEETVVYSGKAIKIKSDDELKK